MILLDTNLLARITNSKHPQCADSRRAIRVLSAQREQLIIVPQNLYEFWAVATRKLGAPPPGQNGLGMTTNQASLWLGYFQRRFQLIPDRADLVDRWHDLVKTHGIKGLKSHDARLVAAMQTHRISRILTFNANDFKGFPITIIDPASV
jgi:predicted nucleic acid-binding protein